MELFQGSSHHVVHLLSDSHISLHGKRPSTQTTDFRDCLLDPLAVRAATTTSAPALASSRAITFPVHRLAPVIMATLFARENKGLIITSCKKIHGGGGGIRTHGPENQSSGFQDRLHRPLGHPSCATLNSETVFSRFSSSTSYENRDTVSC
jgi:hypothetical protein